MTTRAAFLTGYTNTTNHKTMYTERLKLEPYPYHGTFYMYEDSSEEDGSLIDSDTKEEEEEEEKSTGALLEEDEDDEEDDDSEESGDEDGEEEETEDDEEDDDEEDDGKIIVLETCCDIQQNTALFSSATITRGYKVYFPFDSAHQKLPENLKPGILFTGEMHGLTVAGTVMDPVATQMDGCMVEIRGSDV